ncbi:hypothetical protein ACRALDRAFT_1079798 [Sodiomyces alcalophilus JCM 7366]|uniref:uncharacterized protein n=1 Tax=Sodiomyces alcalophilus JCM 7366 TaxID=591952 RepID=UPI0039B45DEB
MAPGTRRAARAGIVEHDDFEGLPVRQWRQELVQVASPPPPETTRKNDIWSRELLWGMPRDTALLPQHSQELLRAARAGRLYKRPAEDDEVDPEVAVEKTDKKEEDTCTQGFQAKVWKQVDRNAEGSPPSYLAKRRKGVVTIASKSVIAPLTGATVTRATVRRIDAAGNPYTQEVTLQHGQQVDGEIISTTVVPAPAPGDQVVATPPRNNRRPPPPKKQKKLGGPGRGRKKKLIPLPAPVQNQAPGTADAAVIPKPEDIAGGENVPKQEQSESNNPDSEMAENDDEGDDDGDEGEEGEEGEGEDGESKDDGNNTEEQDQEMTDAPPTAPQSSSDSPAEPVADTTMSSPTQQPSLTNPLLAPHLDPAASASPKLEGSPLKNVIMPSPTDISPQRTSPATDGTPQGATAGTAAPEDTIQSSEVPIPPAPTEATTTNEAPAASDQPAPGSEAEQRPSNFIPPADRVGNIPSPEPPADVVMGDGDDVEMTGQSEPAEEQQGQRGGEQQQQQPMSEPQENASTVEQSPAAAVTTAAEEVMKSEETPVVQPSSIEEVPLQAPAPESAPESTAPVEPGHEEKPVEMQEEKPEMQEKPVEMLENPEKPEETQEEKPEERPGEKPEETQQTQQTQQTQETQQKEEEGKETKEQDNTTSEEQIQPTEAAQAPEPPVPVTSAATEAEEEGPDLLAGLETALDRQAEVERVAAPTAPPEPVDSNAKAPETGAEAEGQPVLAEEKTTGEEDRTNPSDGPAETGATDTHAASAEAGAGLGTQPNATI